MSLRFSSDAVKLATASAATVLGSTYLYLSSMSEDIPRDFRFILKILRSKRHVSAIANKKCWSIIDLFQERVERSANKLAITFLSEEGNPISYTYREVDERSNQVANWAHSIGLQNRDVVALVMDNRPEFIFTWLGLAKLNVTTALINTHLKGKPLQHSLHTAKANTFIIGIEHVDVISRMRETFKEGDPNIPTALREGNYYSWGGVRDGFIPLDEEISKQSTRLLRNPPSDRSPMDSLFYIYTSGTTGLPKASVIRHIRAYFAGFAFSEALEVREEDVIYNTLPIYHSSGGMLGITMTWHKGCTLVLRRKFSASKFWKDCRENNCTVIQYIGELCRYLLAQAETPQDKQHKVRLAIGNGLRPDIWRNFQERFHIEKIGEFYASTEGNANLVNVLNREGAVGFIPPLMMSLYPVKIVKYDVEKEDVVRDKNGFCIACNPGEPGELIGMIDDRDPLRSFSGYTDKKATEKKILCNVMKKGDRWFRTGDLLKMDTTGNFFFVDRVGDTFRWKGENVSTGEVEQVISRMVPGVKEVTVYGVPLPGHDGRCGMACIVKDDKFNLDQFYEIITRELPRYAAPLFVRLKDEIEITTTFKHKKMVLVNEGFDIHTVKDPIYMRDDKKKEFIPVDERLFASLQSAPSAKL